MKPIQPAMLLAILSALGGCVTDSPSGAGNRVRAIVASQVLPHQEQRDTGTDGVAAVAAYTNYQHSYVTPTPQDNRITFGSTGRK